MDAKTTFFIFMVLLLCWSIIWITLGIKHKESKGYVWKTHLYWNVVNLLIALGSLVFLLSQSTLSADTVRLLRTIVLVNVFFDIGYVVTSIVLRNKNSNSMNDVGKALTVQGAFLLVLDISIVIALDLIV